VSLGQSNARRENPGPGGAGRPASGERNAGFDGSWTALGEAAVPMRGAAQRKLDRDREERIRALLEKPRLGLPRPPARALVFGLAGVVASTLLGIALAGPLAGGNGGGSPGSVRTSARVAGTRPLASNANAGVALLRKARVAARTRRRAAIRADRQAARRRARQRGEQRKAAGRAKPHRQPAPTREPLASPDEVAESTPPPSEAIPSAPPPEGPTSSAQSQVQREFGFER